MGGAWPPAVLRGGSVRPADPVPGQGQPEEPGDAPGPDQGERTPPVHAAGDPGGEWSLLSLRHQGRFPAGITALRTAPRFGRRADEQAYPEGGGSPGRDQRGGMAGVHHPHAPESDGVEQREHPQADTRVHEQRDLLLGVAREVPCDRVHRPDGCLRGGERSFHEAANQRLHIRPGALQALDGQRRGVDR